jgi:hypothetical protein
MGQAKRRGTFEERRAQAIATNGGEERPKRLTPFMKRQREREYLRRVMGIWTPKWGYDAIFRKY